MASFTHEVQERGRPGRPSFSSYKTSDRLRDCDQRASKLSKIKPHRLSIFKEEGLDDLNRSVHPSHASHNETNNSTPPLETEGAQGGKTTFDDILSKNGERGNSESNARKDNSAWFSKIVKGQRPVVKSSATAPPGSFSSVSRVVLIAFLIAVVVPGFRYSNGGQKINISGAEAGVIRKGIMVDNGSMLEGRAHSPTDTCTRWSHQGWFFPWRPFSL